MGNLMISASQAQKVFRDVRGCKNGMMLIQYNDNLYNGSYVACGTERKIELTKLDLDQIETLKIGSLRHLIK